MLAHAGGEGSRTRPLPRPYDRVVPETILTEQRGDVLLITLDRPEKLNAWTTRMGRELKQAIGDANVDADDRRHRRHRRRARVLRRRRHR